MNDRFFWIRNTFCYFSTENTDFILVFVPNLLNIGRVVQKITFLSMRFVFLSVIVTGSCGVKKIYISVPNGKICFEHVYSFAGLSALCHGKLCGRFVWSSVLEFIFKLFFFRVFTSFPRSRWYTSAQCNQFTIAARSGDLPETRIPDDEFADRNSHFTEAKRLLLYIFFFINLNLSNRVINTVIWFYSACVLSCCIARIFMH